MRCCLVALACSLAATAPSTAQPAWPTTGINCAYRQSNDAAEHLRAEERCLSALNGNASRVGNVLEIRLRDGTTKSFISNYDACEGTEGLTVEHCVVYWLEAYMPKHRAVLVNVGHYESGGFEFLNVDSGHVTQLEEEPHFSPSGDRFAVVKASESEAVYKDVAIYAARSGPPVLEFSFRQPEKAYALYSFAGWAGENRVNLKLYTRERAGAEPKDFSAAAVRTQKGWRLEGTRPGPNR